MSYPSTWVALVSLVSAEVVTRLAAAGYPALTPEIDGTAGAILLGPQFRAENGFPPRIVFVPSKLGIDAPNRSVTSRGPNVGADYSPELQQRAIGRQMKGFKVYCWGCNYSNQTTPAPDPALDYDAAQANAEIIIQACQSIGAGRYKATGGTIDGQGATPTLVRTGRVFIFDLELDTAILDTALAFAPSNVAPNGKLDVTIGGTTTQAFP